MVLHHILATLFYMNSLIWIGKGHGQFHGPIRSLFDVYHRANVKNVDTHVLGLPHRVGAGVTLRDAQLDLKSFRAERCKVVRTPNDTRERGGSR